MQESDIVFANSGLSSTDEVPLPSYIDKKTIDKLIQEGNNVINTQFTTGNGINIENHLDRKVK